MNTRHGFYAASCELLILFNRGAPTAEDTRVSRERAPEEGFSLDVRQGWRRATTLAAERVDLRTGASQEVVVALAVAGRFPTHCRTATGIDQRF